MSMLLSSMSHYIGLALDIAIVLILLLYALIGLHKGFLQSIIALFSTAVVLFLSIYFANGFAKILNSAFNFTNFFAKKISPSIEKLGDVFAMVFPAGVSGSAFYSQYIASSSTNGFLKKFFQYSLKGFSAEELEGLKVADVLAGSTASILMTVIAGIVLFIIIKIILGLLSRFFDNITRTRVLGGLNKILGLVFGLVKGAALLVFFLLITICVSFIPKVNKQIYPLIQNETRIVKIGYNLTDKIVGKYLIKSDVISKWINNLWDGRHLEKEETKEEDPATTLSISFNDNDVQSELTILN